MSVEDIGKFRGFFMKSKYMLIHTHSSMNNTEGVKSAEGDNIKYPRVKKAFQVEETTASL